MTFPNRLQLCFKTFGELKPRFQNNHLEPYIPKQKNCHIIDSVQQIALDSDPNKKKYVFCKKLLLFFFLIHLDNNGICNYYFRIAAK